VVRCPTIGKAIVDSAISVQANGGPGRIVQPAVSRATTAGGSKLRRRLSNSFQRPSAGTSLGRDPVAAGTLGSSHGKSCQSPRTQRCWRPA
jgi:hypothetical protein